MLIQRNTAERKDLVLMIGRTGQNSAHDVHSSLHYMVPDSATAYHLRPDCKSIMKGGRIIRTDPSPRAQNRHYADPGTLIEQAPIKYENNFNPDTDGFVFRIRRIGDDRLSFVQFNHDPTFASNSLDEGNVNSLLIDIINRVNFRFE
jgi:hypothetical protein